MHRVSFRLPSCYSYAEALLTYSALVAGHLLGPAGVSLLWRVALRRILRVVGLALALRRVLRVLGIVLRGPLLLLLLLLLRWGTSLHGWKFPS